MTVTRVEIVKENYSLYLVDAAGVSLLLIYRSELDKTGRSDLWISFKLKELQKSHDFVKDNISDFPESILVTSNNGGLFLR